MLWAKYLRLVDNSQKQGNEKPGEEGQSGQVLSPYAGHTAIANHIQPPTSEGIHLVPNLGQPVTQTNVRMGPMSPASALVGPTHRHGESGVDLLDPTDSDNG